MLVPRLHELAYVCDTYKKGECCLVLVGDAELEAIDRCNALHMLQSVAAMREVLGRSVWAHVRRIIHYMRCVAHGAQC